MPVPGPFSGVTVIDLTRVLAGPFSTMILSDLGARVIKVETPGTGDDAREYGPFVNGKSAYFVSVNRGKESIALNLKDDADRVIFEKLLDTADIIVENYRPGTMEKLGYGWEDLHAKYPKLIYAACSGFGHTGPHSKRPAYDMVVQAMGGIMSITGQPGGEPTRVGMSIGDIGAGLYTTIGMVTALYDRERTGQGRKLDIGMLDCQIAFCENAIARFGATGEIPGPLGGRHPSITPFQVFKTLDGHMIIAAGNNVMFHRFCDIIGRPDLKDDQRYESNRSRTEHQPELEAEVEGILATRTTADWLSELDPAGIPASGINNVEAVMAHPQVAPRKMVIEVDDPKVGKLKVAGNPVKLSGYEDPSERPTAPDVDQDRARILSELNFSSAAE
ncbi:MAG: CaiB/BaiF CoA transferase family protein [Alphaproteobacteria bacterium]|jgi:CoA:oxalate CoA-transferase